MAAEHGGHGGHHGPGLFELQFDWERELSLVGAILGLLISAGLTEATSKPEHPDHGGHGGSSH